jgi:hypothetical protein
VLGENETKCSSWATVGLSDELASVVVDNRTTDGKAQTHAMGLRRVKRLKDRLQLLSLNANSVIFYFDSDASKFGTGHDGQLSWSIDNVGQRIGRV